MYVRALGTGQGQKPRIGRESPRIAMGWGFFPCRPGWTLISRPLARRLSAARLRIGITTEPWPRTSTRCWASVAEPLTTRSVWRSASRHCATTGTATRTSAFQAGGRSLRGPVGQEKRDLFDDLGEEGLRRVSYQFHGDPYATFGKFFGYSYASSDDDDDFPVASGSGRRLLPKNPPVEHGILVTLEEIAKGCTKRLTISQRRISFRGRATRRSQMLIVEIRPGWKAGTRITFTGVGDQLPNRRPGDVIFVLREKPHPFFRREGCDLRFTARISLGEALGGAHLEVPTLQGESLHLCTKGEVISQNSTRRFPGQGLPHQVIDWCRGDLVVDFSIKFPETISDILAVIPLALLPRSRSHVAIDGFIIPLYSPRFMYLLKNMRLLQGAGNPSRSVTDYKIPRAIRKLELHDHPDKNEKSHAAEIFEQLDKKKGSPAETFPVTSSIVINKPSRRVLRFQRSGVRVLRRRLRGEGLAGSQRIRR
nr:uncharacterized protein LOC108010415 [Drosophila suzukii]